MSDIEDLASDPIADIPDNILGSILGKYGWDSSEGGTGELPSDEPVEQPQESPPAPEDAPGDVDVPVPPGGPLYTEETDDEAEPGAPEQPVEPAPQPAAAVETDPVAAAVAARAATDPVFKQQLAQLLLGTSQQQAPAAPPVPQFSEEDLENPALRAVLMIASEQQKRLDTLQQEFAAQKADDAARQQRELQTAADTASAGFQTTYNIPPALMAEIRTSSANHIHAAAQVVPLDPLTNAPNYFKIMEKALELSYWASPAARQFEYQRQDAARQSAHARKQKLGGISGSSGSGPRSPAPFDLSTDEGKHQAAVAEITAAMFGSEQ